MSSDRGMRLYGADPGPSRYCDHCGSHLTPHVYRVLVPEDESEIRACPHCPDRVRDPDGTVREARSYAGSGEPTDVRGSR